MTAKELTITVKGEDSTYKQKFLIYEDIVLSETDDTVKDCIDQALACAKIEPDSISIRCLLVLK